jgi:lipid-A-disaccharide synthase
VRVMISCGEPSGDLYAAELVREIRAQEPTAIISGFGGDRLRAAGADLTADFSGLSVTGLVEAVRVLPRTYRIYRHLVSRARIDRPDVFVAVDFPDFNFMLARALKRLGIPVVYYISPQLWAWRPRRIHTMRRIADLVLVIFEFEERIYRQAGVQAEWVGHPLLDLMPAERPRAERLRELGLPEGVPVVAILPGSRPNELRQILPGLVSAAALVRRQLPAVEFIVARAPHLDGKLFAPLAALGGRPPLVIDRRADDVLAVADVALVASGTVTVQAALHECPMVVVYRLSPLTYRIGRPFVRVDTFAMANLVAGRTVVPERIQDAFVPERVAADALAVLTDADAAARIRDSLREVRARLGEKGASRRAARAVLGVARRKAAAGLE